MLLYKQTKNWFQFFSLATRPPCVMLIYPPSWKILWTEIRWEEMLIYIIFMLWSLLVLHIFPHQKETASLGIDYAYAPYALTLLSWLRLFFFLHMCVCVSGCSVDAKWEHFQITDARASHSNQLSLICTFGVMLTSWSRWCGLFHRELARS